MSNNDPNIADSRKLMGFDLAVYEPSRGHLPMLIERLEGKKGQIPQVELEVVKTRKVKYTPLEFPYADFVEEGYAGYVQTGYEKGLPVFFYYLVPIKKMGSEVELIEDLVLKVSWVPNNGNSGASSYKRSGKLDSKLGFGEWHRIEVSGTGVYKLNKKFFADHSIDIEKFDSRKVAVFGYGGEELPMSNSAERPEDLIEIPSKGVGLSDGVFNDGDYLLFYAQGPITWSLSRQGNNWVHAKHTYAESISYMVCLGGYARTEIPKAKTPIGPAQLVTNEYDYRYVHHNDFLTEISKNVKTGKEWFGEEFNFNTLQDFDLGSVHGLNTSFPVTIRSSVAGRSIGQSSSFTLKINGKTLYNQNLPGTGSDYLEPYVSLATTRDSALVSSNSLKVSYQYNKSTSSAVGWLNYFEIIGRAALSYPGGQWAFRDKKSIGNQEQIVQFNISTSLAGLQVWRVDKVFDAAAMETEFNSGILSFKTYGGQVGEYIAFMDEYAGTPSYAGRVLNQNIHGLPFAQVFIVAYDSFVTAAKALASFHQEHEGYKVNIVTPQQIYNEFSSGTQDISAIRDCIRYFYENAPSADEQPKFLILFGDASYDFKDRIVGNTNLVPSYQSNNSISPTSSYMSDDYYGLLDPSEGNWETSEPQLLDIAIGRLPVHSVRQAMEMVEKIKAYHSPAALGDWRNNILFVADDEDDNLHLSQTEEFANFIDTAYPLFNVRKLYFDAYVQQIGASGAEYPDVKQRIDNTIENGVFIINYMGHGGELGWAHERVLDNTMIKNWRNAPRLPLFVTATCELSRFDDPTRTSAGEHILLNPDGGAIALLTTTRVVYAGANAALLRRLYTDNAFEPVGDKYRCLGEIIMTTKNNYGLTTNTRNFSLLGDPVVGLAYPKHRVVVSTINGKPASEFSPDTLTALSKVSITGFVADANNNPLPSFNGVIYPTVFDKKDSVKTLANDPRSKRIRFGSRHSIIYKGKASVSNGQFNYSFIVPKDIAYKLGQGKISHYTENGEEDGNGMFDGLLIGGTATNSVSDDNPPSTELYINDIQFSFGGISNESPLAIGYASDDNGINTVGTGIGHALTMTLDDNEPIVVNDYYEGELDDYTTGWIRYPFKNLTEGRHTLSLKVWDVANNSATAYTEFVVASTSQLALEHVLNYPNPFSTRTTFWFTHNRPGDLLSVRVQIFTISGRLVKTLETAQLSAGSTFNQLEWDGLDDFGQTIGRGVYIYKVSVRSSDGLEADATQKLVILK